MTPNILIISVPEDVHALAVTCVLERHGVDCRIWYQPDFPHRATHSLRLSSDHPPRNSVADIGDGPPSVVWARRFGRLHISDKVHPDDLDTAERECKSFMNALRFTLAPDALWINPYREEFRSNSKALQLQQAAACGMRIPDTLLSNDIAEIRRFAERHESVIYKPHFPPYWEGKDKILYGYTRILSDDLLQDAAAIRFCPGIFQQRMPKAYEARVTVMGHECVTARIDTLVDTDNVDDWRAAQVNHRKIRVTSMDTPDTVRDTCLALMRELELVFGCFDFIIGPDGGWTFLEVNPMGQFLWVEVECPDIPMLETFCNFLMAGRTDFRMAEHATLSGIRAADFLDRPDFQDWKQSELAGHLPTYFPAPPAA